MKANPTFLRQPKSFWAAIRTVGQKCGYTQRGKGQIKVPTLLELEEAYESLSLDISKLRTGGSVISKYASDILAYCAYRADVLNTFVEPRLMNAEQAKAVYQKLKREFKPKSPIPLNKQGGNKKSSQLLHRHRQHPDRMFALRP